MGNTKTGVYPCYENQFSIGDTKESATGIADAESFSVSFDNGVEEWTPFDTEGWVRRLLTAKRSYYFCNSKEKRRRYRK